MTYIQDGLYIGNIDDAYNTAFIAKHGITHILTADAKPLTREGTDGVKYKYVHALDMITMDLLSHFESCIEFIDKGRKEGGILVHW
mgnify:CR=1 FL=1